MLILGFPSKSSQRTLFARDIILCGIRSHWTTRPCCLLQQHAGHRTACSNKFCIPRKLLDAEHHDPEWRTDTTVCNNSNASHVNILVSALNYRIVSLIRNNFFFYNRISLTKELRINAFAVMNVSILNLTAGNVYIDVSAVLTAHARGFSSGLGREPGITSVSSASGAGHGGAGGRGGGQRRVGKAYGILDKPTDPGSGGGQGFKDMVSE